MSTTERILAIDQGTTNTKALLVAADGRVLHQASAPNIVTYPQPGWAEQSATALVDGVKQVIAEVVATAGGAAGIAGIAISNQRESVVVWDAATGEPIGPSIVWQCHRSAERCDALRAAGHTECIEAALFGHGVRTPGAVKATYGTGTSLMTLTPERFQSTHGISSTIAWSEGSAVTYALEGNISVSGQTASFIADLLGLRDAAALSALAETVPDSNGVAFVPALVGLGAPHWRAEASGIITGMSLGTRPAHLARAALEAIAFQVADVFMAMEQDIGTPLAELRADGGASRNRLLMQLQADILDCGVAAAAAPEVSALGAAAIAFAGLGIIMPPIAAADRYEPAMDKRARTGHRQRWQAAIAQTLATTSKNHKNNGGHP